METRKSLKFQSDAVYIRSEAINTALKSWCSEEAQDALFIELFKDYQSYVRPVINGNPENPIIVKVGLELILLVNLTWNDPQLTWNPLSYSNITVIQLPPDKIWLPDVVLFNNADGQYEASYFSNVNVRYDGRVQWVPPAIYKTSCTMDVQFFPFDSQSCTMIMGTWTYNRDEVSLALMSKGVDLSQFDKSTIWDLWDVPTCLDPVANTVHFSLVLKRKPLFYSWVLLIPSVILAIISAVVFYMPTESREKIGLSIYVLLSIDFFLVMVSKILPQTSSSVPLMAKYQVLTFALNIITILVQVVIINIFYRAPDSHVMSKCIQRWILKLTATLLCMKKPKRVSVDAIMQKQRKDMMLSAGRALTAAAAPLLFHQDNHHSAYISGTSSPATSGLQISSPRSDSHHPRCPFASPEMISSHAQSPMSSGHSGCTIDNPLFIGNSVQLAKPTLLPHVMSFGTSQIVKRIQSITTHLKNNEETKTVTDDWRYVGMVLDRLFLLIFFGVTLGGTIGIIFSANVFRMFDQDKRIEWLQRHYNWTFPE